MHTQNHINAPLAWRYLDSGAQRVKTGYFYIYVYKQGLL